MVANRTVRRDLLVGERGESKSLATPVQVRMSKAWGSIKAIIAFGGTSCIIQRLNASDASRSRMYARDEVSITPNP